MLLISRLYGGCFGEWNYPVEIPDCKKVDTVTFLIIATIFKFVYVKIKRNKGKGVISLNSKQLNVELDVLMQSKHPQFQSDKAPISQFSQKLFYIRLAVIIALASIIIYVYNVEIR